MLGPPGAGKGTQAWALAQDMGLAHVASGDIFRTNVANRTELGQQARSYMDKGLLVPDEITIRMVLDRLTKEDTANGAVLDGFPRTNGQAEAFDQALGEQGQKIGCVVYLSVGTPELVRRLSSRWICRNCQTPYMAPQMEPEFDHCTKCGGELYQRDDDKPETIAKRLDVYFMSTAPLIDYYRSQGKLVEVDGERPVDRVRIDMRTTIQTHLTN